MVAIKSALVWPFWLLALAGWILLLSGNAALQQNCSSSSANALNVAGTIGYLGPVDSCSRFYNLTWWTTWYFFLLLVLIPSLAITKGIPKFRAGLIGLLGPLIMLLMNTANTFVSFNGRTLQGSLAARAKCTVAGSIIASIALFSVLIILGATEETLTHEERVGIPSGQTYGGVYPHKPTTGSPAEATAQ